jgi:hypothetical protein
VWKVTVVVAVIGALIYSWVYRREARIKARKRHMQRYKYSAIGLLGWAVFGALRVFVFHA